MTICSFCDEYETASYWTRYCPECSMLRRMLIIHDSKKCLEILKRVLIRNPTQIDYKVQIELKKKLTSDIEEYDKPKPNTRSSAKKVAE